jgi:hypothetical protein
MLSFTTTSNMLTGARSLMRLSCFIMRGNNRLGTALSLRTGITAHLAPSIRTVVVNMRIGSISSWLLTFITFHGDDFFAIMDYINLTSNGTDYTNKVSLLDGHIISPLY